MDTSYKHGRGSDDGSPFSKSVMTFVPTAQHQHNGIAERAIRTIKEKATKNLIEAFGKFQKSRQIEHIQNWWFFALKYATTVKNIMPKRIRDRDNPEKHVYEPSPYTQVTGKTFHLTQMHPFWAKGYSRILQKQTIDQITPVDPNSNQNKLNHQYREEVRFLFTDLHTKMPIATVFKHQLFEALMKKSKSTHNLMVLRRCIMSHTDINFKNQTFTHSMINLQDAMEDNVNDLSKRMNFWLNDEKTLDEKKDTNLPKIVPELNLVHNQTEIIQERRNDETDSDQRENINKWRSDHSN